MNDEDILDMIFNSGLDGGPKPPPPPPSVTTSTTAAIDPALLFTLRSLEAQAIQAAEAKDLTRALALLDECILKCSVYASAWNNRAQVRQLIVTAAANAAAATVDAESSASTPSASASSTAPSTPLPRDDATLRLALADVNEAIRLGSAPETFDPFILKQAYTQRGLIRKALQEDEESVLEDYKLGASYGNTFAKKEAVRLNPYAALCNQYLQQALEKHWSGLGQQQSTPATQLTELLSTVTPVSSTCGTNSNTCHGESKER